jgi:hypothetical protein
MLSAIVTSNYQASLMPQLLQLLSSYGQSLPAHDPVTGLIPSATVTALLATIAGNAANDINGRRAADAANLSNLLQLCGLYSPTAVLTATPTTISATGPLTSTNQIVNNAGGTTVITLPSPASMVGQPITIKTTQAQLVTSASANVVPLVGGAAAAAILAATIGKWAALVSDGTNFNIMMGN